MKLTDLQELKKDEDFSNFDGWLDAGVKMIWPEAELTADNKAGKRLTYAHFKGRAVGMWDHKLNKGYVVLSEMINKIITF
jgi:hypothetical protein